MVGRNIGVLTLQLDGAGKSDLSPSQLLRGTRRWQAEAIAITAFAMLWGRDAVQAPVFAASQPDTINTFDGPVCLAASHTFAQVVRLASGHRKVGADRAAAPPETDHNSIGRSANLDRQW
jgi:hypothetical protein